MSMFNPRKLSAVAQLVVFLSQICHTIAKYFVVLSGGAMLLTIFLQVVFRYVIKGSLPWSEEVARYLMIWIGFIGGSLAFRSGEFIGIEVLRIRMSPLFSRVLEISISISLILFLSFLVIVGVEFSLRGAIQLSPVLRIKMTYAYMAIPIGAGFCLVHACVFLLKQIGLLERNEVFE